MMRLVSLVIAATVGLLPFTSTGSLGRSNSFRDWATIQNTRFGFQIAYPAEILIPTQSPPGNDGRVLKSRDGKAKLLVATFDNSENLSLGAYRDFLLSDIYAKARLDYQPIKARWFVISGVRGNETFYERVTFSCGGRLINSWAIVYPTAERQLYDRVVEAVAGTFTVGAGADGNCGENEPVRAKVGLTSRRR
jgi:hypothetical protein